jgi:hypothetical protein
MTVLYISYAQRMDYRGLNGLVTPVIYHMSWHIKEHS